jgi:hypothetical protein
MVYRKDGTPPNCAANTLVAAAANFGVASRLSPRPFGTGKGQDGSIRPRPWPGVWATRGRGFESRHSDHFHQCFQ